MNSECKKSRLFHLFLLLAVLTNATASMGQGSAGSADAPKFTEQQVRLIHAIWDLDLKGVERLLRDGLSPNYLFRSSPKDAFITPLAESIAERQPQITALLFLYGAEANFGEKDGAGALGVAAWYDDADMVKELLKRGASVDARDNEGHTPLLSASYKARNLTVIKLLIAGGADVKAKSSSTRRTTVMLAASSLNLEAVNFFIDLGVDPCAADSTGETAIDSANMQLLKASQKVELNAREAILRLLDSKCTLH
jgi:ankyrin repeat protein